TASACVEWFRAIRALSGSHVHSATLLFTRHRAYAASSVAVLATAIGGNLIVFTVVNALWLRPAPYQDPDQVVTIPEERFRRIDGSTLPVFNGSVTFEGGAAGQVVTYGDYAGLRIDLTLSGRSYETVAVTSGYFSVLDIPLRGR